MKTIGLLGGMSWESTTNYYKLINEGIKSQLGGLHSARITMYSVDFAEIEALQHSGDWDKLGTLLGEAAQNIANGGADFLIIATNTMHKVADQVHAHCKLPLLHIADATAEKLKLDGIQKVGLLGTRFTMEQDFYKGKLTQQHGIDVIVPNDAQRTVVHDVIYNELCRGIVTPTSRDAYIEVIDDLYRHGAEAIILGCTEIGLLVSENDTDVPLYDTTVIHAAAAVECATN